MQHLIAVLLVTLFQVRHGSEQIQERFYRTARFWTFQLFSEVNLAIMSAWLGMVLETTTRNPVQ